MHTYREKNVNYSKLMNSPNVFVRIKILSEEMKSLKFWHFYLNNAIFTYTIPSLCTMQVRIHSREC